MKEIKDIFKDYPEILDPKLIMNQPNEEVVFHDGSFSLKWKSNQIELIGKIVFKWLPDIEIKFYGNFPENLFDTSIITPFETNLLIEVEAKTEQFCAKGILQNINTSDNKYHIIGYIRPPVTFGDLNEKVQSVYFEVPNLRDFHGLPVRKDNSAYKNRVLFENNEYKITLDRYLNYSELKEKLTGQGGYLLLYSGKLESKEKREFSYEESEQILETFTYFLHFINGRRTSPIFRYGTVGSDVKWKSITPFLADRYKYVISWPAKFKIDGLSEVWMNFSELWKNESDRECIKTVLHWYVEANSNAAFIEGSIVLIQNALELLFHWLIAEKRDYVNVNDADSLSASAKIGFLLSNFNIASSIPEELAGLKNFAKQYNITSGPDSFIRIRNCIVHPSEKKRKTLKEIEDKAKYEALHLGIGYVEKILLKQLEFKGAYNNRFSAFRPVKEEEK